MIAGSSRLGPPAQPREPYNQLRLRPRIPKDIRARTGNTKGRHVSDWSMPKNLMTHPTLVTLTLDALRCFPLRHLLGHAQYESKVTFFHPAKQAAELGEHVCIFAGVAP
jgi:hypothetical protein